MTSRTTRRCTGTCLTSSRRRPKPREFGFDPLQNRSDLLPNLEVPEAQHGPAEFRKLCVDAKVAGDVRLDLLIPVRTRPSGLVTRRVAVPKRPVDEYGDATSG